MNKFKILMNGLITENPTFVLLLGMCPALGTTSSAMNGLGMGLATTFVLIGSNTVISMVKNIVPDKVRIPIFVVIIASFVSTLDMLMKAYVPTLYASLGLFIPLIVVNCIVLARAESFACKNMWLIQRSMVWELVLGLVWLSHYLDLFVRSWVPEKLLVGPFSPKITECSFSYWRRVPLLLWVTSLQL